MEIEIQTVAIWKGEAADGDAPPQLVDALERFGKSRATRLLIRRGEQADIRCGLRAPFLRDCRVRSDELGRALRKVWRAVMDAGKPGDQFVIDLQVGPDSRLMVRAERNA